MQKGDAGDGKHQLGVTVPSAVSGAGTSATGRAATLQQHVLGSPIEQGRQSITSMASPNRTVASGQPSVGQGHPGITAGQSGGQRSAAGGVSGTVHHLGHGSTLRAGATPFANLQQGILAMSMQSGQKAATPQGGVTTRLVADSKAVVSQTAHTSSATPSSTLVSKLHPSPGPSPRKKIKVEETPAPSLEIAANRKLVLDDKLKFMREIKESYIDHLTEFFFLQNGGNLMDYHMWKKRPTPQLVQFLKSGNLDSDDEEENPLTYLQEKKINEEVKVLTTSGSNVPVATPVAISTTLPPSVAALSQQGYESRRPAGGRHGMVYGRIHHPFSQGGHSFPTTQPAVPQGRTASLATTTVTMATALSQSSGHMFKSASDTKLLAMASPASRSATSLQLGSSTVLKKSPPTSPGRHRQNSSSFDGTTTIKGITTQEAIVERAKQEAQVMHRVSELRKEGLWSARRLPKVQEPPRNKAHWDYLLEEMQWLAADFLQERKWKKACARKLAKSVQKHFQDLEQKELKAEKEEGMKLKRVAGQMAKMVKEFWTNIEKVVQYKQQSRLDEKRQKALDLHLNFIVDQTEKYSTWLTEGLAQSSKGSSVGSKNTTPDHSIAGDDEFQPEGSDTDDEETIDKDEEGIDESETRDEIEALQKESELPLDELLKSLPQEVLQKPASVESEESEDGEKSGDDEEFKAEEMEVDVEDSIAEQEKHERKKDVQVEINDLKEEGDMSIDELRAKYAKAYDSDFEMPEDSYGETDSEDEDEEESESEEEVEEEEEEEEEEVDVEGDEGEVGLEYLMNPEKSEEPPPAKKPDDKDPGKEITDIAAEALSLQPKGYTLQTTEVKTEVPFLLKHTLREYQHVGLDWLATMYDKKLNGILADEMGLGKTIQTIALLAHLATEKGIWGPHLIVVPTSVMLNWEMELKKWCPAFKILTYYGSQKERKQKRTGWTKTNAFHICITSYKLVIQDHQSFRRKKWKYFILDEAQNIKNFKSQRWQTLLNFSSQRRLLLTGTPLQNSLMELWSLMHFLMPHVFQSHREFKEWFANPMTGMVEGSREYNEGLIRRLHKVLRPFLLRRLKDDVEKQMPKKYEHVVMCHLSKRQRFLYDEFMSQSKTKETLASGHFMSVINILMQLRKVCNHPSLFDPRPIISPFKMEGLVYQTASQVLEALEYDPFEHINLRALYPSLADMERDLPAFIAHRVRKLQAPRKLIEEIDDQSPPAPRPQPGKLKPSAIRCVSPGLQSGRSSPHVQGRSASPVPGLKAPSRSTTPVPTSIPGRTPSVTPQSGATSVTPASVAMDTTQPPLQARVVPQTAQGTSAAGVSIQQAVATSSQPITVQIQHTEQGTRLMIPSAGFLQIVQTSSGQQLIASSAPSTSASVLSTSSNIVNGPPTAQMATYGLKTSVSSAMSQVKMSPTVQLPVATSVSTAMKPIMRVSPLGTTETTQRLVPAVSATSSLVFTTASTSSGVSSVTSSSAKTPLQTVKAITEQRTASYVMRTRAKKMEKEQQQKSEFFMESLFEKRWKRRQEKLDLIANTNKLHCEVKPVYGQDLCEAVDIHRDPYAGKYSQRDDVWRGMGPVHCHCAATCCRKNHPSYYWNQTQVLSEVVHNPEQYLKELEDVLTRFVFNTPPVTSTPVRMRVSHPPPGFLLEERYREFMLHTEISPKAAPYHKISTNMTVQFPELRLIQYDCGKLQTLDILLRQLKSGDHRVLIFTQMTRMLDILEAFLNYHGHRYLRLDGTTRVEQRQLLMDRFNADRRIFCFILSTRSGGIGVNLTGADTVIFYDSDWNPTMDAQAQDRCHRIGQTRDVHIYRLISQKTIEENILKKANQKRMLGDMAIEGGNFTTAFFKEQTLQELFSEPLGLDSLVKEKEDEEKQKLEKEKVQQKPVTPKLEAPEASALAQFEKALAKTEDESDAIAAEKVKAEQKAELAEFDENIPWDEREAEQKKEEDESRVEMELAMLDKELTPVERYAVGFMELQMEPVNTEELLIAEEDITTAKENWELNRLKALKEEEERRAELEEDEMLYTYSRDDAYQQVKKRNKQLAVDGRRALILAKDEPIKPQPQRKSGRRSVGSDSEMSGKSSSVPNTPKPQSKAAKLSQKITPKSAKAVKAAKVKAEKPEKVPKVRSTGKKEKPKANVCDSKDTNEDVDVETVSKDSDLSDYKKQIRKNLMDKVDKRSKNNKKLKNESKVSQAAPCSTERQPPLSTEATSLSSLPGNSSGIHVGPVRTEVHSTVTLEEEKRQIANARTNIFDQFEIKGPDKAEQLKSSQERSNIFEQFGQSSVNTAVPGSAAGAVRFVTSQQGRPMVVVSSAGGLQSAQNVVLLQGFPSNLLLGGQVAMSLQGMPVNMATVARAATPVNLGASRLANTTQLIGQRLAARIVSPQVPGQRLVTVPTTPVSNMATANPALNRVPRFTNVAVPNNTAAAAQVRAQAVGSVGSLSLSNQLGQQLRLQTPVLTNLSTQVPTGPIQTVGANQQPVPNISPVKMQQSNLTNIIAAGNMGGGQVQLSPFKAEQFQTSLSVPNAAMANVLASLQAQNASSPGMGVLQLTNAIGAQNTVQATAQPKSNQMPKQPTVALAMPSANMGQQVTKVVNAPVSYQNQTVVNIVSTASLLSGNPAVGTVSSSQLRAASPAVANVLSTNQGTARAQSPTIVKLVAASNIVTARAHSPILNKQGAVGVTQKKDVQGRLVNLGAVQSQLSNDIQSPTVQQAGQLSQIVTGIKGLPAGMAIPASLVSSLTSGSISGVSKTNLNVLKGLIPAASLQTAATKGPVRLVSPGNINMNANPQPAQLSVNDSAIKVADGPAILNASSTINITGNAVAGAVVDKVCSPRPTLKSPANTTPTTLQAWSNPNLVIRTRRAAQNQKHQTTPSNPLQQVFLSDVENEQMPLWAPPTPPQDDNDVYLDETLFFLYEPTVMPETQLPPIYIRKERKKLKTESITTRKQKQRKEEQPRVPRSLFDRPTAQLLKLRREAKIQKLKQGQLKLYRPMPSNLPTKPHIDTAPDQPEWLIHEDWALLQTVQSLFDVPLNLMVVSPAHIPNWDMVADVVNSCSRVYRSPKQCKQRYENVIIPREEGRIMYDFNPRKQKKTKSIYKTKNNRPMKTSQIHGQDSNNGVTILYSLRFDSVKGIATKRPPTMRQTLVNPTLKNPKHASVLQENNITYDQPRNPMEVAEIRAQRIQREKKQSQQQQQQQQAAAVQQTATDQQVTVSSATVQRTTQVTTTAQVQQAATTIVAVTTATATPQLATLGTVPSSATVLTVTGPPLTQGTIRPRSQLTVQEITAVANQAGQVAAGQATPVRAQLQTTTGTTALAAAQIAAQRIGTATTVATSAGTVQQQLQVKQGTLTPQHFQLLRNQTLFKQQQQQQIRNMQKLSLTQQQQLRQLKAPVLQGSKVIASQLVQAKPGQARPMTTHVTRPWTPEDLARLKQQQLTQQKVAASGQLTTTQTVAGTSSLAQIQHHPQTGQLQTTQIIAQAPVQQVGQSLATLASSTQGAATLVKTVSSPAGSVTIPVSINVSMPQKTGVTKATLSQINPTFKQVQLLQQRKVPQTIPAQKTVQGQKVGNPQLLNANAIQIIQQQGARGLTVQQLQHLMKQQQGATIQQIIHTSQQPTIIATVTQSQSAPQMVTKVIGTTSAQTSQVQALTGATTITVTSAPVASLSSVPVPSLTLGSQSSVTASIVKPATVTSVSGDNMTTVQIHPVNTITQSKLAGLPQNVLVQSVQQVAAPVQPSVATQAQQVSQVTVTATPSVQQVQATPTPQPTPSPTVTPNPMTVTVTPTPNPAQTPIAIHAPVTVTYTTAVTSQSPVVPATTLSTTPITVSAQTVQQTVAAVLQPQVQQQAAQQPGSQPTTPTTIVHQQQQVLHTQQVPQSQLVQHIQGQVQTLQAGQGPGQPQTAAQQQASKQAPYAMRTRNQPKPH